jgi:hypothetical protein
MRLEWYVSGEKMVDGPGPGILVCSQKLKFFVCAAVARMVKDMFEILHSPTVRRGQCYRDGSACRRRITGRI